MENLEIEQVAFLTETRHVVYPETTLATMLKLSPTNTATEDHRIIVRGDGYGFHLNITEFIEDEAILEEIVLDEIKARGYVL